MAPFSGTRLSDVFRVFDVDVALCGHAVVTRGAEGGAGSVTSDDITFFRDRISKIRARCPMRNEQGYNSISGQNSIRANGGARKAPAKNHPASPALALYWLSKSIISHLSSAPTLYFVY